jgi:hypothetical protein
VVPTQQARESNIRRLIAHRFTSNHSDREAAPIIACGPHDYIHVDTWTGTSRSGENLNLNFVAVRCIATAVLRENATHNGTRNWVHHLKIQLALN